MLTLVLNRKICASIATADFPSGKSYALSHTFHTLTVVLNAEKHIEYNEKLVINNFMFIYFCDLRTK